MNESAQKAPKIVLMIPALNEGKSIGKVLDALPRDLPLQVIVADNGSEDDTPEIARNKGALVVHEPRRGYGWACLAAMARAEALAPDIAVFLDGDYSDYPEEVKALVAPILNDEADMVIGSRVLGEREAGALLPQARFGNWLAATLMRWIWGFRYTDLGPFRAIRWQALQSLAMQDKTYGWTVEMQIKALQTKLRVIEVPVRYRPRIGKSKVTGTLSGTVKAGYKILFTIFRYGIMKSRR